MPTKRKRKKPAEPKRTPAEKWADLMRKIERTQAAHNAAIDAHNRAETKFFADKNNETARAEKEAAWEDQRITCGKLCNLERKALATPAPHAEAAEWKLAFITREVVELEDAEFFAPFWAVFVADIRNGLLLGTDEPASRSQRLLRTAAKVAREVQIEDVGARHG